MRIKILFIGFVVILFLVCVYCIGGYILMSLKNVNLNFGKLVVI